MRSMTTITVNRALKEELDKFKPDAEKALNMKLRKDEFIAFLLLQSLSAKHLHESCKFMIGEPDLQNVIEAFINKIQRKK